MAILSINPATEELLASFEEFSSHQLDEALDRAAAAFQDWRRISFAERRGLMAKAAGHLREHKAPLEPARTADLSQAYAQPGTGVRGGAIARAALRFSVAPPRCVPGGSRAPRLDSGMPRSVLNTI